MKGKELAEYCKDTRCRDCTHKLECENFINYIMRYFTSIAPCTLLDSTNIIDKIFKEIF